MHAWMHNTDHNATDTDTLSKALVDPHSNTIINNYMYMCTASVASSHVVHQNSQWNISGHHCDRTWELKMQVHACTVNTHCTHTLTQQVRSHGTRNQYTRPHPSTLAHTPIHAKDFIIQVASPTSRAVLMVLGDSPPSTSISRSGYCLRRNSTWRGVGRGGRRWVRGGRRWVRGGRRWVRGGRRWVRGGRRWVRGGRRWVRGGRRRGGRRWVRGGRRWVRGGRRWVRGGRRWVRGGRRWVRGGRRWVRGGRRWVRGGRRWVRGGRRWVRGGRRWVRGGRRWVRGGRRWVRGGRRWKRREEMG